MAKSSETFNKKENEKKRLKKKKDKEQKKEDRKANEGKAKSFDDMIAYVDENGNLTSTPPDPSKKRVVNIEEIQIGVAKKEEQEAENLLRKGTVSFFNTSKGYGFIKDHVSQESIFVHINGLVDSIKENDKVTYTTEQTPKGKSAVDVKLA